MPLTWGESIFDILPLVNEGDSLPRLGTRCRLFDGFLRVQIAVTQFRQYNNHWILSVRFPF
jgi:hypothetical protein